jgi:prophage antirepressor-like protein
VTAEVLPSIRKTGGYGQLSPALIGGIVKGGRETLPPLI